MREQVRTDRRQIARGICSIFYSLFSYTYLGLEQMQQIGEVKAL
jgi:hypothetical protein